MERLDPLKETRTAIIDKETKEISFESLIMPETEQKKESAKKILFENKSVEKYIEQLKKNSAIPSPSATTAPDTKFEFEATKSFFTEELETVTKKEIISEPEVETKTERAIEIHPLVEEDAEDEIYEESKKGLKPKTNFKARLKIIAFGFFAILTCFLGWSIYNAVEIETLRAQMESANKTYAVNIVKYIKNISKADDLTSDSIFNLQELSQSGVVPLEPGKLEKPIEYTLKSNWFDRFCNWLFGIFK